MSRRYKVLSGVVLRKRRHSCFQWNAVVIVKVDIAIEQSVGLMQAGLDAQKHQLLDAGYKLKWVFLPKATKENLRYNEYYVAFQHYQEYNKFAPIICPCEMRHTFVSVNDEVPTGLKNRWPDTAVAWTPMVSMGTARPGICNGLES